VAALLISSLFLTQIISFGLAFMGPKFSEEKLIAMAYAFEQRTKARDLVQPYIMPTTELQ
jgi:amidase